MDYRPKSNTRYYKTLREKHRTLFDINCSNIFFNPLPRVMEIKIKINKWNLIKCKSFCKAKDTTDKMKDNPQNGRKYLAKDAADSGLVSRIYKQLMWLKKK